MFQRKHAQIKLSESYELLCSVLCLTTYVGEHMHKNRKKQVVLPIFLFSVFALCSASRSVAVLC